MPSSDAVLADLHVAMWREQMIQRERAEAAETRVEELEAELAESQRLVGDSDGRTERLGRKLAETLTREAAWAERARGGP